MRNVLLVMAVVALVGCGDAATDDSRGYTKAPLEAPGLLISPEPDAGLGAARIAVEPGLTGVEPAAVEAPARAGGGSGAVDSDEVTLASGVTRAEFTEGQALFAGEGGCQACHGQGGAGGMLGPDLTDEKWLHVDAPDVSALADVIRNGVAEPVEYPGPMPPMGGATLTGEQIQALAGYVASLGGD